MNQARIFSSFIKQIIKTKTKQPGDYYTTKTTIQSSVGIIFKCHTSQKYRDIDDLIQNWKYIQDVSVLMAQRAGYEKDLNAYNVVFPGGQADPGQTDLQACKRQLKEEVDLTVDQQCTYVGRIPQNFYYAQKRGKYVYISCNIWLLKPGSTYQPKLNPDQLIDYRWVPVKQLVDLSNYCLYDAKSFGFFKRLGWKSLRESIESNLVGVGLPAINVGLKRQLWGLTLWLVSYIIQMSEQNIKNSIESPQDKTMLAQIGVMKQKMKAMEIIFKKSYLPGTTMAKIAKMWHYKNRVHQFTYIKSKWLQMRAAYIVLVLILVLTIILVSPQ